MLMLKLGLAALAAAHSLSLNLTLIIQNGDLWKNSRYQNFKNLP